MEAHKIEKDAIQALDNTTAHIVKSEKIESSAEKRELSAPNTRREKDVMSAVKDDVSAVTKTAEKYELIENNVLKIKV